MLRAGAALLLRHTADTRPEFNVFHDVVPHEKVGGLIDHAALRRGACDLFPGDGYLAARGQLQPGDEIEDGRFAALAGAEEHHELVFIHLEVEVVHDEVIAGEIVERLADMVAVDDGLA